MRTWDKSRFLRDCVRIAVLCLVMDRSIALAQQAPVIGRVEVVRHGAARPLSAGGAQDQSNVVVWLTPLDDPSRAGDVVPVATRTLAARQSLQLVQRNKSFEPHVLVAQVGSTVQFPNKDPFFHNVFSLFDGKRFDLGLYEGGSSNSARFDRPGVSFLFCNIHPEMSGIVVVVDTPYFALSDRNGRVAFPNVPHGRYLMHVWYERSSTEDLKTLERMVNISDSARSLETVLVIDSGDFQLTHKNKYGQDYTPQTAPAYKRP
jgi:plastocyanin